ncbi:major facilitator superfamily MFS_1 [Segniliparus rotundus DSM 44985]|uniref:Major facilitator superfamily MFS_1 n=1 Tax=Segniliparus rotundus (strain ATCC BAA-972 / CDC 1076 / CIP 108378 / DSM 44985 / JCM 13578) TaxID=640132 RepID=D6Z9Q7_SEGRD|nr:MFS transporter [Segniliparus rotundus]ADG96584.1 major facilitator superfamily MFS_1 [Segniliparus rotundus DSM 44985]
MTSLARSIAPLKGRDYRLLFLSCVISMLGDGVWLVAVPWLAIQNGADSAGVGAVVGAESVGLICFVLIGGVLTDRFSRKLVVGWSHCASFIVLAALGAITVTGSMRLWHLALSAFLLGAAAAISGPATDALVPDIVPSDDLHAANALESMARSVALRIAGPTLGGLLVALLPSVSVIAVNAASFFAAACCVALLRTARANPAASAETEAGGETKVSGRQFWRYLYGERWLWVLILWAGVLLLLQTGPRQVLLPLLVHDRFDKGASSYGILIAASGVTAILASLYIGSRALPPNYPRRMLLAWMAGAVPLAAMVFVPSFWWLLPLMGVYGFFSTIGNVYWFTLLQIHVPDEVRGRVISVDWLGSLALVPASAVLAGASQSPTYATSLFVLGGTLPVLFTAVLLARVRMPEAKSAETATTKMFEDGVVVS